MIDFSRRCAGAPFNNQSRTRGVGVPLCSGPSSLVLVQGTEVRILPGLPLNYSIEPSSKSGYPYSTTRRLAVILKLLRSFSVRDW